MQKNKCRHAQAIPASALAAKVASEVLLPADAITQEGNGPLRKTDAQGPQFTQPRGETA